jgi:hypothetical protein
MVVRSYFYFFFKMFYIRFIRIIRKLFFLFSIILLKQQTHFSNIFNYTSYININIMSNTRFTDTSYEINHEVEI